MYNIINNQAYRINLDKNRMQRSPKAKNQKLYKLQEKIMELHDEVINICNGKKGQLRSLVAGRYNFSSRAVIAQNPQLRIDQVTLPYTMLCIMLQPRIINTLNRMYNMSYSEANNICQRALANKDDRVAEIIDTIIRSDPSGEGIPVIINRNPTISYGLWLD